MDPNEKVKASGQTALMLAAQNGHTATMRALLSLLLPGTSSKASIDAIDKQGLSALHYSARVANHEAVRILVSSGADVNLVAKRDGETPLYGAVTAGCDACVDILLSHKAEPNSRLRKSGATPLHSATANGKPALVDKLLKAGADKSIKRKDNGLTALDICSNSKTLSAATKEEIVKLLFP